MSVRVILAPSLQLANTIEGPALTVEAEYGSTVVEGTWYTAAHHQPSGPYQGRHTGGTAVSPCNDPKIPVVPEGVGVILLSHIDLDSVGGALRALGKKSLEFLFEAPNSAFWELAEFIDTRGPHRLAQWVSAATAEAQQNATAGHDVPPYDWMERWEKSASLDARNRRALQAYWAWSKTRPRFPRDAVTDVTAEVREHGRVLALILQSEVELEGAAKAASFGACPTGDEAQDAIEASHVAEHSERAEKRLAEHRDLLAAGDRLAAEEAALNAASFVRGEGDVLVRVSDQFVNALYTDPSGRPARAVAALNSKTGAVTVSLADPVPGVSCRQAVQLLWGFDAGGHDGIAGSPRGQQMTQEDLDEATGLMWTMIHHEVPEATGWRARGQSRAFFREGVMVVRMTTTDRVTWVWECLNPDPMDPAKPRLHGQAVGLAKATVVAELAAGLRP